MMGMDVGALLETGRRSFASSRRGRTGMGNATIKKKKACGIKGGSTRAHSSSSFFFNEKMKKKTKRTK